MEQKIEIFPNPIGQTANISLVDLVSNEPVAVEILDAMGRSVKTIHTYGGGTVILDLSNHPKGVYLVRALQTGKYYHVKFVKE
jgi:hypothetical protein